MKTAVLLSGGVDSSLALQRLVEQGANVHAFYLKIWLEDELSYLGDCPWEEDLEYAQKVCSQLGVPLDVIPLQREYWDRVVSYTIAELEAGRTPSPDVFCNQRIKFGAFVDEISDEFDRVASGHYAQVRDRQTHVELLRSPDPIKDQTYFLSHMSQDQVSKCVFPIGDFTKSEVRELAERSDLPTSKRKDSQGICFLGKIRFRDFVSHHLGEKVGEIRELQSGERLGEHRGFWFHTVGQRKGLGLHGGPWFVARKDVAENVIYVTHQKSLISTSGHRFRAVNPHWIWRAPQSDKLQVKIRHSEQIFNGTITPALEGEGLDVELAENDPGIADGQIAVFYEGEVCLGGATIQTLGHP